MKLITLNELETSHGSLRLLSESRTLQHKKNSRIVLVPQPNKNDSNDPLNWPRAKKLGAASSVFFLVTLSHFMIAGIAPGLVDIAEEFRVGSSKLAWLVSISLAGAFVGCYTIAPLINVVGRRPVWLFCAVWLFCCTIWAAKAKSYSSLLVARLLAAWAAGASEPISASVINDLFFLHERGTMSGVQGFFLSFGSSIAPVVTGFLIQAKGWRWYNWLGAILAGTNFLAIFFFSPETLYPRNLHLAVVVVGSDANDSAELASKLSQLENRKVVVGEQIDEECVETVSSRNQQTIQPKSLTGQLKPWSPVHRDVSILGCYARPLATLAYPATLWATLAFAMVIATSVVMISLIPIYLSAPPYLFSTDQVGLTFIASTIGQLIGACICGVGSDKLAEWSARRNGGVFEPEMRLPLIIIPTIAGPAGLLMFGIGLHNQAHWIVPVIGSALVGVNLTGFAAVVQPYLIDIYGPVISDVLVTFNGVKGIVSGVGFGIVSWISEDGIVAVFCTLSALSVFFNAGALLIWKWGKASRKRDGRLKVLLW